MMQIEYGESIFLILECICLVSDELSFLNSDPCEWQRSHTENPVV